MDDTGKWARTIERFVLAMLVALGAVSIVSISWARDYAVPRATVLGADRGISVLVTAGPARVLILSGTDPTALGNAISEARHPGLDRIDILIVSGNAAAASIAPRAIDVLQPREVFTVGSAASIAQTSVRPAQVIESPTEIELPQGVSILIDVWPAAGGENDDTIWSATIERGGASVYWVSDREALMQDSAVESADVTVIGRGRPAGDTPYPITDALVVSAESISGPELRQLAEYAIGPEVETKRIFAGEVTRIDLDPAGIGSVPGAIPAATPATA